MELLSCLVYALVRGIVFAGEILVSAIYTATLVIDVHLIVSLAIGHLATIPSWYPLAFAGITLVFWVWVREFGISHFFRKSAPPTPT